MGRTSSAPAAWLVCLKAGAPGPGTQLCCEPLKLHRALPQGPSLKSSARCWDWGQRLLETSSALPPRVPSQDYVDALTGVCYDGIEGLLYLGLFSLLAVLAFSTFVCAGPRAWKCFAAR